MTDASAARAAGAPRWTRLLAPLPLPLLRFLGMLFGWELGPTPTLQGWPHCLLQAPFKPG